MDNEIEVLPVPGGMAVNYSELEAVLFGGSELEAPDPTEGSKALVRQIMEAKTADDVLREDQVVHARDVLGQSLTVVDVRWNRSTIEGSLPIYAVMGCVDEDGQAYVVTCGGIRVMAQLARLAELGALPARVKVLEAAKPTADGFRPLRMVAG